MRDARLCFSSCKLQEERRSKQGVHSSSRKSTSECRYSDVWFTNRGSSAYMIYRREWLTDYRQKIMAALYHWVITKTVPWSSNCGPETVCRGTMAEIMYCKCAFGEPDWSWCLKVMMLKCIAALVWSLPESNSRTIFTGW